MRGLRVLMLGQPRLEFDGQALTRLIAPKHQALVFYLAAERGAVSRSRLASLLWSELDEQAARANLRVALTRLRRWLPGLLDTEGQQVGFVASAPLWVDLRELEQAASGSPAWPLQRRVDAARAWRGPLLDGFELPGADSFEQWATTARQRAARAALALRRELAVACEASGSLDEAIDHARAWLDIDDTDEAAHLFLMRLLAATGRRTAAIAQYEACRASLADRLGARPSADCYALYCRIHADAPRPAAAAGAVAPPPAVAAPSAIALADDLPRDDAAPLIGRTAELALLAERLADPACRWLTIVGPGGVGKTRLARAAASSLQQRFRHGALWLSGRDRSAAALDLESVMQQVVTRIGADASVPDALLLVLDNLETLPGARALVRELTDRLPGIVGLATSRSRLGLGREWLLELGGLSLARRDDWPASSDAARLFIEAARRQGAGFEPAAQAAGIERICALVGGLPLALEMAARGTRLSSAAAIAARIEAGAPLEDPDRDPGDRHHSIALVLEESWARLPPAAQAAALRLAALPGEFDLDLAAAVGVDAGAVDQLRAHSWNERAAGDRLSMHPLQHDFLRRHEQAAPIAEEVHEALARHLQAGLPSAKPWGECSHAASLARSAAFAAPVLASAARHVCALWPLEAQVPWIDAVVAQLASAARASEAAELVGEACSRADLPAWQHIGWSLKRAELHNSAGDVPLALRTYDRALQQLGIGDFDPDAGAVAGLPGALGRIAGLRGWPTQQPERDAFTHLVLRSLLFVGQILAFMPEAAPLGRSAALAHLLGLRAAGRAERAGSTAIMAYGASLFGAPRCARWLARKLPRRAPVDADARLETFVQEVCAVQRVASGQWQGLLPVIDDTTLAWQRLGDVRHEMECRSLAGKLAFYQGLLKTARDRFVELTELASGRPGDAWRFWGSLGQVEVGLCLGTDRDDTLRALLERGGDDMTRMENIDSAYTLRRIGLAARLAWRGGELDAVREAVLAGVATATRIRYCGFWAHEGFAGIAEVLIGLRMHERRIGGPVPMLDEAWRALQRPLRAHCRRFVPAAALWHHLQGLAAIDEGRSVDARRSLRRSVREAERRGMRVELARVCQLLAKVEQDGHWADRAARLWADMGVIGALESGAP